VVFASLSFLYLFLPLNLALYASLRSLDQRNALLVVFSLVFYAWGEPVWLSLLVATTVVDFHMAGAIERWRGTARARWALWASLSSNLGLLAVFKYSALAVATARDVLGIELGLPAFALPIGISFYTFQSISYVVDVWRGAVPAERRYSRFLLFVSLYHQLVAGPIVRYVEIAKEIGGRGHDRSDFAAGVTRFCGGLFKKVCIANVAGELVARYLDGDLRALSVGEAWLGLIAYTLQIYFDFSGYSDMAIGLGRMFGFHYGENFNYPYVARSATEFWRRWHISLGSFFRDYLYVPLGGKRVRPYRNLFVVWFCTGLWHGASWNFVLWGLYYGVWIAIERAFLARVLERLPRAAGHLYLMTTVVIGWSLFYFTDLGRLALFLRVAFGATAAPLWTPELPSVLLDHLWWLCAALALCAPVAGLIRVRLSAWAVSPVRLAWFRGAALAGNLAAVLVATVLLVGRSYNPFLYFRF